MDAGGRARRREQAAEVVKPRLEQAAEESGAGMLGDVQATPASARPDGMRGWIVTPACAGMSY